MWFCLDTYLFVTWKRYLSKHLDCICGAFYFIKLTSLLLCSFAVRYKLGTSIYIECCLVIFLFFFFLISVRDRLQFPLLLCLFSNSCLSTGCATDNRMCCVMFSVSCFISTFQTNNPTSEMCVMWYTHYKFFQTCLHGKSVSGLWWCVILNRQQHRPNHLRPLTFFLSLTTCRTRHWSYSVPWTGVKVPVIKWANMVLTKRVLR